MWLPSNRNSNSVNPKWDRRINWSWNSRPVSRNIRTHNHSPRASNMLRILVILIIVKLLRNIPQNPLPNPLLFVRGMKEDSPPPWLWRKREDPQSLFPKSKPKPNHTLLSTRTSSTFLNHIRIIKLPMVFLTQRHLRFPTTEILIMPPFAQ